MDFTIAVELNVHLGWPPAGVHMPASSAFYHMIPLAWAEIMLSDFLDDSFVADFFPFLVR